MKYFILIVAFFCGLAATCLAEAAGPAEVAQRFYDRYIKVEDTRGFVIKSDQVTPGFKKAYAKFMKEPDTDPIINGQDFPSSGFAASPATVKGETATVTMKSREKLFANQIKVHLVRREGAWVINGVNALRGQ